MKINDFKAEVFFEEYEFSAEYLLTSSDAESMSIRELLEYDKASNEEYLDTWLGYTEVPGNPKLREEIAKLYNNITPEDVIVHSGAEEAIFNFMRTALTKEDHAIIMFPAYQSLYDVAIATGCQVTKWELKPCRDSWMADLEELKGMIRPNTKLICINSPHNPTGFVFSEEEINTIIDLAKKNDIYIFSDEVYKGLEFDELYRPSVADLYKKSLSLGVMSKSYGLAGLRIGWIASQDDYIKELLTKAKHYTTVCNSAPAEYLATLALQNGREIVRKNMEILKKNLIIAEKFFNKYENLFEYRKPMGGTTAYVKMKLKGSIHEFCVDLVETQGVVLLSAEIFDMKEPYFRIGLGRKNFEACLNEFEKFLKKREYI